MNIASNGMLGHLNQFTPRNNSIHNFQKMVQKINADAEAKITNDNTQLAYNIKALMKENKKIEAKREEEAQQAAIGGALGEEDITEMANHAVIHKRNWLMSLSSSMHELGECIKYMEEKVADLERLAAGDFTEEELEGFPCVEYQNLEKKYAGKKLKVMQERLDGLYSSVPNAIERALEIDFVKTYTRLYGEGVKKAIDDRLGDVLDGITPENLGLTDLGTDMKKVTEALDAAAEAVRKRAEKLEENYKRCNGTEMESYGTVPSDEELRESFENASWLNTVILDLEVIDIPILQLDSEDLKFLQEAINNGWIKEAGNFVDAKA